jgi:dienelactone hydrolase
MRRRRVLALLTCGLLLLGPKPGRAQSADDCRETARAVAALQNEDGGFGSAKGEPSSLGATSTAVRILGFVGGAIPDPLACIAYVKSCRDAQSGGFASKPGGTPDVGTTASGLMALGELRAADPDTIRQAVAYLDRNAKSYEDVRIAVAGLEAVRAKPADVEKWVGIVTEGRKPDGTWGDGPGRAFDTGGRAVALLRMGQTPDHRDAIVKAILSAQQPDGGWVAKEGPSEPGVTYRVMRACAMLQEKPDLEALRSFVGKLRREGGLYATAPDRPGDLGGTYLASILLKWARQLDGGPALVETHGFRRLFDGTSLEGWDGEMAYWSADGGVLVGNSPGLDHNTFLTAPGNYRDFVLMLTFRLKDGQGNSGVQFRSVRVPPHEMSGYQADIGEGFWGCLYDESRRNRVLVQASDRAKQALRPSSWNHYAIRALGDDIRLTLNGVPSAEYRETDPDVARDGQIAVQIHAGGPMRVEFKDVLVQPVPSPDANDATTPGFHRRTVKVGDAERPYVVYVPEGYDGSRAMPAILFLHGAGERGQDGVVPSQVGLGPAVLAHPERFPCLVVFPQARQTWQAGSDDAKAALAALDDVTAHYKVDPDRVYLTGLSMGGAGSWSIAAADPGRFAAVVPVCGFGNIETAGKLASVPLWTILGDADMDRIVSSTRAMVTALRDAGAPVRYTEYRSVGHNSWDRAYNDPAVIEWLLSQRRASNP